MLAPVIVQSFDSTMLSIKAETSLRRTTDTLKTFFYCFEQVKQMCIYREYVQPYFLVIQYLHIFTLTLYLRDISVPLIDGESGSGQKVFVLERIDCIIVIIIIILLLLLL